MSIFGGVVALARRQPNCHHMTKKPENPATRKIWSVLKKLDTIVKGLNLPNPQSFRFSVQFN